MSTNRVRLFGGRVTHEATPAETIGGHYTRCLIYLSEGAMNQWKPNSFPVTCVRCLKIAKRERR
jgi:hypothetical protein